MLWFGIWPHSHGVILTGSRWHHLFRYAFSHQFADVMCVFLQEEFCYPVECLALTVEEVMHIRQVLVKAELEKFQQYKDIYNALKKGKVDTSSRVLSSIRRIISQSFKCIRFHVLYLPHLTLSSLALLFLSDQEVLPVYLVVHLPVLQKVNQITLPRTTLMKYSSCSGLTSLFLSSPGLCAPSALRR